MDTIDEAPVANEFVQVFHVPKGIGDRRGPAGTDWKQIHSLSSMDLAFQTDDRCLHWKQAESTYVEPFRLLALGDRDWDNELELEVVGDLDGMTGSIGLLARLDSIRDRLAKHRVHLGDARDWDRLRREDPTTARDLKGCLLALGELDVELTAHKAWVFGSSITEGLRQYRGGSYHESKDLLAHLKLVTTTTKEHLMEQAIIYDSALDSSILSRNTFESIRLQRRLLAFTVIVTLATVVPLVVEHHDSLLALLEQGLSFGKAMIDRLGLR